MNMVMLDGTGTPPPEQVDDIILTDDLLCIGANESPKKSLFWTRVNIQNQCVWALADSGSCRNLITEKLWNLLPIHPQVEPPGHTIVIAGNGRMLEIMGWASLRLQIGGRVLYHDCGIVKDLPIDFII